MGAARAAGPMGVVLVRTVRTPSPRRVAARLARWGLLALVVASCGADDRSFESSVRYEPPVDHRVVVETLVDLPFEATWDALIRRLSESGYRVATLE